MTTPYLTRTPRLHGSNIDHFVSSGFQPIFRLRTMPPRKRTADESVAAPRRSSRRTSTKSQYFDDSDEVNSKEVEEVEEEDLQPKKKRGRPSKKQTPKKEESEEPYQDEEEQQEDDDEDSDDSDAPPKVTFIPLPKLLDHGGIEYEDAKLHPNTVLFLKELKANNRRPWLKCTFLTCGIPNRC